AVGETLDGLGGLRFTPNGMNRTLFVVVTDGEENSSRRYGLQQVRDMIDDRRSEDFQFVFLGDGPGAWKAGSQMGFQTSVQNDWHDPRATENIYRSLYTGTAGFAKSGIISSANFNTSSSTGLDTTPTVKIKSNDD